MSTSCRRARSPRPRQPGLDVGLLASQRTQAPRTASEPVPRSTRCRCTRTDRGSWTSAGARDDERARIAAAVQGPRPASQAAASATSAARQRATSEHAPVHRGSTSIHRAIDLSSSARLSVPPALGRRAQVNDRPRSASEGDSVHAFSVRASCWSPRRPAADLSKITVKYDVEGPRCARSRRAPAGVAITSSPVRRSPAR